MKIFNRKALCLALSAVMIFTFTACSSSGSSTSTSEESPALSPSSNIETLVVGTTAKFETANRSEYNYDVLSGTLCQLAPVYIAEDNSYQPLLCDFSTNDSITWTLKIKDNMIWHDGMPVTSEDIKFTLEYLNKIEGQGYSAEYEAMNIIDDKTISLVLKSINSRFPANLTTLRIIPMHIYNDVTPEEYSTVPNEKANIGCGPYKYAGFDQNSGTITFESFKEYAPGVPNVGTVIFKIFDNADTMYMSLISQEIDMIYNYASGVDTSILESFEKNDKFKLQVLTTAGSPATLAFNNAKEPFNDPLIRKAVASAIDYNTFKTTFGSSYSQTANTGFVSPATLGYVDTAPITTDIELSKKLLEEAGYKDTNNDGFVDKSGVNLNVEILVRSDRPLHLRYGEMIKLNLASAGIDVSVKAVETAVYQEMTQQERSHMMTIVGLTAFGINKDAGLGSLYLYGNNKMSYGQIYDETYIALIDELAKASSVEDYKVTAAKVQQYYSDNIPVLALYWDNLIQVYSSDLAGFKVDGTFGLLNHETWFNISKAA